MGNLNEKDSSSDVQTLQAINTVDDRQKEGPENPLEAVTDGGENDDDDDIQYLKETQGKSKPKQSMEHSCELCGCERNTGRKYSHVGRLSYESQKILADLAQIIVEHCPKVFDR